MKDLNLKEYRLLITLDEWGDHVDMIETNCPTLALDAKDRWEKRGFDVVLYRVEYKVVE